MLYDLSAVLPLFVGVAVLALLGALASVAVIGRALAQHHRVRTARHQSIPVYYRRLLLAH